MKNFGELRTEEMANLSDYEINYYVKETGLSVLEVIAEVENCQNIIRRMS